MPFTSLVVNTQLTLDQKKELAAAVTQIFVDALKVCLWLYRVPARVQFMHI
jgi:hypothetical protein